MEQDLDKTKPLSPSYRDTFRRHRKLFCTPMVLGALAAAFVLFGGGKTYKSTATLWVDTAPPLPSSISAVNGNLAQPPATAAQAILNELLTTTRFAAAVGETALHGKSLGSAQATRAQAAGLLGQGQLVQTVPGAQVLQLTYSASSPEAAQTILAALVDQLRSYIDQSTAQHDQAAVAYTSDQVKVAETALANAHTSVTAYRAQHPAANQTDASYMLLVTAEKNAATQLAQANLALSRVTGPSSVDGWSMKVMDPPTQASSTPLGKKKMVEVIVGGALGGMLVSFLAVVALTPAKKEDWEDELPTGGPFVRPVPPVDPFRRGSPGVPAGSVQPTAGPASVGQPRISLGERRFQVPARSAPAEDE